MIKWYDSKTIKKYIHIYFEWKMVFVSMGDPVTLSWTLLFRLLVEMSGAEWI